LTLTYYLKFLRFTFFGKSSQTWQKVKEVPLMMGLSMIVLTVICMVSGLLIAPSLKPFLQSAVDVLLTGSGYKDAVFSALIK
jgi:NADH:ubiquinone oxidoreductase subunit 5 (subunit L)/multisubunit Na+/H+ antiporter MnhA subunit